MRHRISKHSVSRFSCILVAEPRLTGPCSGVSGVSWQTLLWASILSTWRCYMRRRSIRWETTQHLRTALTRVRRCLIQIGPASRRAALHLWTLMTLAWHRFIRQRLVSQKTLIRFLFPSIALVASIVLLSPLLIPQGLPFYGDETYYIPWTLATLSRYNLQIWTPGNGPSTGVLSLFPTTLLIGLRGILGQELGVKGYLLLMAWLSAINPYAATRQLLRHWKLVLDPLRLELASGVSGLVCLLFFSNHATVAGSNSFVWNYSMFPLLTSSLVIFMDTGRIRQLLTFGVASIAASPQPFWPYLVGIVGLIYLIFALVRGTRIPSPVTLIKHSFLAVATGLGFNAFWIVPTAAGYVLQAGGSTFQLYGASGAVSLDDLGFLSFWSLQDVLLLGESAHYFFWDHPQTWSLFSFIIPLLAVISVLAYRRNRSIFFVGAVLIVGVFATAGVNEPIGSLYYLLTSHLPYGAAAILRNPTKFVPIVTFSYGLLLGLGVIAVSSLLSSKRLSMWVSSRSLVRYSIVLGLVFLVLAPITYGTLLDLQGYTWPRYSPTNIPQQYGQLNNWLTAQSGDYKVMWIPAGGAYDWKTYAITAFPDLLSSEPTVPFNSIYPNPLGSTHNIGKILPFMGVKYVAYHGDSINYLNDQILQDLLAQRDLATVESLNGTVNPNDDSHAPLPIGAPGTEFVDRPFHLPNITLTRSPDNLTMSYTIPQTVRDQGYTGGQFADYFVIGLHGFPAGSVDFSNQLFFATVAHQDTINATNGYASFNVTSSLNYPETSIDLYANFYDGGFRPLTPIYFIDRLTLVPSEVTNRYFIFENKDFAGPVFSQTLNIANNANVTELLISNASIAPSPSANLTGYQQTSGAEFRVTARASAPFVLILTEPYDRLWRAYVGTSEIEPGPIYGLVNGFVVNQTGVVNIRIYYTLQSYLYLGMGLSAARLSLSLLVIVLVWRENKRKTLTSSKMTVAMPVPAQPLDLL